MGKAILEDFDGTTEAIIMIKIGNFPDGENELLDKKIILKEYAKIMEKDPYQRRI